MSSSIAPDFVPADAERPTADIIAFPGRPAPAQPLPQDRLSRALDSLNTALAEQRVALAAWRGALGELKQTTVGLGESLQRYHASLGSLSGDVAALNQQARSLDRWADGVLAD